MTSLLQRTPIGFGPRGCPDARLWMHSNWRVGAVLQRCWQLGNESGLNVEWTKPELKQIVTQDNLKRADLYWVGADMCDLVAEAMPTVPMDVSLTRELVPVPFGLAFFESTLKGTEAMDGGEFVPMDAVHWYPCRRIGTDGVEHHELNIDFYSSVSNPGIRFVYIGGSQWGIDDLITKLSDPPNAGVVSEEVREQSFMEDRRLLISLLGLIASPGVTDATEYHPNRAERRRSERSGIDLDAVRVINLRGSRTEGGDDSAAESRYHNRWMVSGHWRSQPCGPGRSLRRPVWIAPHVKGPEGAPLLRGEKVRVLR